MCGFLIVSVVFLLIAFSILGVVLGLLEIICLWLVGGSKYVAVMELSIKVQSENTQNEWQWKGI